MTTQNHITTHKTIDATGLNCPLPILKTRQALLSMNQGQVLKIIATDPTSAEDFPLFAEATGNRLLAQEIQDNLLIYYLSVQT